MTRCIALLLALFVAASPASAGTALWASPVAKSVPFDTTSQSYLSTNIQDALQEVRERVVWPSTSTATTASGTLTLTASSLSMQFLTGSATAYSVVLPDATTLFLGRKFEIDNQSSQPVTITDGSGAALVTLGQTSIAYVTLQTNGTTAGGWVLWQVFTNSLASGILNYQVLSSTAFDTASTTDVMITGFTVTPQAGTYAVWYNGASFLTTTPKSHWWSIYKNGTRVADSERSQDTGHSSQNMTDSTMSVVVFDGSETCDVRVRTQNGTLTVNQRTLLLIRLGS